MPQTLDIGPEVKADSNAASPLWDFQETTLQTSVERPAIVQIRDGVLHYASPQCAQVNQPALSLSAPSLIKPRGFRVAWYELGFIALAFSSAAVCVYRLIWATQP